MIVHKELKRLKKVVEDVTGLKDISVKNRNVDYVISRAVYIEYAFDNIVKNSSLIGRMVKRDHASILSTYSKLSGYKNHYSEFNDIKNKVVYLMEGGSLYDEKAEQYIENLKSELNALKLRNIELEKAVSRNPFLEIPEHLIQDFTETRLKPYLKMNK